MNTVDLIDNAKESAEADNQLYARAIDLLQDVYAQIEGGGKVKLSTVQGIEKLLDDSYAQALK